MTVSGACSCARQVQPRDGKAPACCSIATLHRSSAAAAVLLLWRSWGAAAFCCLHATAEVPGSQLWRGRLQLSMLPAVCALAAAACTRL